MTSLERGLISIVAQHGNVAEANDGQLIKGAVYLLCKKAGPALINELIKEWQQEQQLPLEKT